MSDIEEVTMEGAGDDETGSDVTAGGSDVIMPGMTSHCISSEGN